MNDLREWVMANAMQSKRPEIGEEIIDALAELEQLRIDLGIAKSISKIESDLKTKYIEQYEQLSRDYALLQVSQMTVIGELANRRYEIERLKADRVGTCAYCGEITDHNVIKAHIETCEKHPLVVARREIEWLHAALKAAQHKVELLEFYRGNQPESGEA